YKRYVLTLALHPFPTRRSSDLLSEMEGRDVVSGNLALNWTPDDAQRINLNYGRGSEERERNALSAGNYYVTTDLVDREQYALGQDRKSTRLNSSHVKISYAVFC